MNFKEKELNKLKIRRNLLKQFIDNINEFEIDNLEKEENIINNHYNFIEDYNTIEFINLYFYKDGFESYLNKMISYLDKEEVKNRIIENSIIKNSILEHVIININMINRETNKRINILQLEIKDLYVYNYNNQLIKERNCLDKYKEYEYCCKRNILLTYNDIIICKECKYKYIVYYCKYCIKKCNLCNYYLCEEHIDENKDDLHECYKNIFFKINNNFDLNISYLKD